MKNGCRSHRQGLGKQFIAAVVMAVLLLSCSPSLTPEQVKTKEITKQNRKDKHAINWAIPVICFFIGYSLGEQFYTPHH